MKPFYLLLAALLSPLFLLAQSNFIPGYVVSAKGDTIKGYVDYKEWEKSPKSINFKNNSGQINKYIPATSMGFGITGHEYYQSWPVSISQNTISILNVQTIQDTSVINDVVYLQVLTTGKNITLYKYTDNIKNRFYYTTAGNKPQELIYKVGYRPGDGLQYQYNNRFRIQLQNVAQQNAVNTQQSDRAIINASYNETDLVNVAHLINNNNNYVSAASNFGIGGFLGLSANFNSLKDVNGEKASNTAPAISAGVDLFLNKTTQSVFFRMALSVTSNKFSRNVLVPTSVPTSSMNINTTLKQTNVSFNPQVVYNIYNTPMVKVFISGGILLNQAFSVSYKDTYTYSNNPATTYITDNTSALHKFWAALPTAKIGMNINKKIEFFAGYIYPAQIGLGRAEQITTYQAGLNYLF